MMLLYLIRHAQSQNNALPEEQRTDDPAITDMGQEQALRLGGWIPTLNLTQLYVSPFLRTLQTAAPLVESTGLTPRVRVELHEKGGCYSGHDGVGKEGRPGMTGAEILERFPQYELDDPIDQNGWWASKPYETAGLARHRARSLLRRAVEQFDGSGERVGYVMHADIKMLCVEEIEPQHMVPRNTSVTAIEIDNGACRLVDYNRVDHLAPEHFSW